MALQIKHLYKKYKDIVAVNDMNLELPKGQVLGMLGRNGAGKTTTLKMLLGLVQPTSGEIWWEGKPLNRSEIKFGYLPEERGLYPKIKVVEQLRYFGQLEGMSKKAIDSAIDYWFERLEMNEYRGKVAGELSKGNSQKVQLIGTLLHDPDFIILDEPFSGLDPVNAEMLSSVIEQLIADNKTIILSSHRMEQIEQFCENVVMMKKGQIVLSGKLNEIKENYGYKNVKLESEQDLAPCLNRLQVTFERKNNVYTAQVQNAERALDVIKQLEQQNITLRSFSVQEPSLHQIFIERVG
ncbi:ABC transporter ATP-binding protein [Paenibacillus xylaniclasticus]|uniref:ABC transporter ATP-binding protein n=1 Tax=Paenibacillus xylaniclasticus TaxID=588083 RepID=UPI000FDA7243|nr:MULTISPECIES: ATP-binding cassette domain-containing protein [Paenibacillus]